MFQKEPVINEIREVETFIFEQEKKKNDYEKKYKVQSDKKWLTCISLLF